MARTSNFIRHLNAVDLGIEIESSKIGLIYSENDALDRAVPIQADGPIITEIVKNRLISRPGRAIAKTAPITHLGQYLADQFTVVVSALKQANAAETTLIMFRDAQNLLQDWSITKHLSFGAHLYLLESSISMLEQELSPSNLNMTKSVIRNSRMFINNFEEWHAFVKQSAVIELEVGEHWVEIANVAKEAAQDFPIEQECVDPGITQSPKEFSATAFRKKDGQSVAVAITSALRSITNISITFVNYVSKLAKDGYESITKNDKAMKLIRTICRFFPQAMQLASNRVDLSWLVNHADDIRALCDALKGKA